PHALAERAKVSFGAAVGDHALHSRQRRADTGHLGFRLSTTTDYAERRRTVAREELGGDRAGRARAQAPEPVGFDHRYELRTFDREQRHHEGGSILKARVRLDA